MVQKLLIGFSLLFFACLLSPNISSAEEEPVSDIVSLQVEYEKVNPSDGFAYLRKRLGEKFKLLIFSFSSQRKEAYYEELADRRLAELKYTIDNNYMNDFEKATTRYSTTVGMWTDYILEKDLTEEKVPAVELLSKHVPVIEKLMENYDATTAEWRFVKQDFDYLQIYASRLRG